MALSLDWIDYPHLWQKDSSLEKFGYVIKMYRVVRKCISLDLIEVKTHISKLGTYFYMWKAVALTPCPSSKTILSSASSTAKLDR